MKNFVKFIDEIDADGSGTIDFDGKLNYLISSHLKILIKCNLTEFMEVMTGE